jgi:hypothetical protein
MRIKISTLNYYKIVIVSLYIILLNKEIKTVNGELFSFQYNKKRLCNFLISKFEKVLI